MHGNMIFLLLNILQYFLTDDPCSSGCGKDCLNRLSMIEWLVSFPLLLVNFAKSLPSHIVIADHIDLQIVTAEVLVERCETG